MMARICLSMIVKNEAARIERCLASVAPHISCWAICDTGSTDGTPEIVRDFFGARSIRGSLYDTRFVDFSTTRNEALEWAQNNSEADYILLIDADMELVAPDGFGELTAPGYLMLQRAGDINYWNARLIRRDVGARYKGVTHEYLETDVPIENLAGPYFIDHADGANRPGKFDRDIALLERAVAIDPDDARSWFYLAQSHRDAGHLQDAISCYARRAQMGGWDEEVWYSRLAASRAQRGLGDARASDGALRAFNARPSRGEPLADLSRHYRELGLNEVSLMFAKRGLAVSESDDLLFVENRRTHFREDIAICGYYSVDPDTKELGAEICDDLALDRTVSRETRDLARANLFWYTKSAAELMPSFSPRPIDFTPPEGWRALNPSIARYGDRLVMVVRTVNYTIDDAGRYVMPEGDPAIRTRNFLAQMEDNLSVRWSDEIPPDQSSYAAAYKEVVGYEDMRLFAWKRGLWATATVRQDNVEGWAEQHLMRVSSYGATDREMLAPDRQRRHEKNWMPLVDGQDLRLIYSCDPTVILSESAGEMCETIPGIAAENFSGGSQAISFDDGWLAIIHEVITSPIDGKRCYQHRFVWFASDPLELRKVSCRFFLQSNNQIEYVAGMAWHRDRLVLSYGIRDCEAWLATVEADDIRALLRESSIEAPVSTVSGESSRGPAGYLRDAVAGNFRREVVPDTPAQQQSLDKTQPPEIGGFSFLLGEREWIRGQTNRALLTEREVDIATERLLANKLPVHPDRVKNWDSYIALGHCFAECFKDSLIIDAGGTRESAFLPGLHRCGFTNLLSLNLCEYEPETIGGVSYGRGDITRTGIADRTVDFVACLSVIEHGVDWHAFLREMARIIKLGGHLFLSFDYWETPINCNGQVAFGAPVKIFDADEVCEMLLYAGVHGLQAQDVNIGCKDQVVNWLGLNFTFMNLLFRRG